MDLTHYIKRLRVVPNLFNINMVKVRRYILKDSTKRVYIDDSHILEVPQQNLESFVQYLLQQLPESEAENNKVLLSHPNNINAICMKIILSANANNFTKAEEHLERQEELKDDHLLVVEAEAEVAYAYSKMGVEYTMVAISKFTKVVEERPDQYDWKYRLASLLTNCQQPNKRILFPTQDPSENFVRCKTMFEDIISNCSNDTLKALSLVGLALLHTKPFIRKVDFRKIGIDVTNSCTIIKDYLKRAKDLDNTNPRVLLQTGRILRTIKEFEAARSVLELSLGFVEYHETYHHLALIIQNVEGTTPLVIEYLEKASRNGQSAVAAIHLGEAYMHLNPPNFQKALKCFKGMEIYGQEYSMKRQQYEGLSKCYETMMHHAEPDNSLKNDLLRKMLETNQKSIVFGILSWIKSTPKMDLVKLEASELFPGRWVELYDYKNQKVRFLNQLHFFQGKCSYRYLERLQYLVENGSIDCVEEEIKEDLEAGKYEECLETILFLLITDIHGIDPLFISTMVKILQVSVETGDKELANKSFLWPIEYLYMVDDCAGHFRILTDPHSLKEAKMIETWLKELGMNVVRNGEDISPCLDRQEALVESFQENIAVLCIIKGNNSTLSEKYPLNMLRPDKPHLLLVVVDNSPVPDVLKHHKALKLPSKDDDKAKAAWLKDLAEMIFHCE